MQYNLRLIALLIFASVANAIEAKQEVTFKNVSIQTKTYNEVKCIAVQFDAVLKYSYNQMLQQHDSCDQYVVEVYLKTDRFIGTTKGYGTYQNAEGKVKNSYTLLLSNDVRFFDVNTLLIPFAAIDLPEGRQTLTPVFKVINKKGEILANNIAGDTFPVVFPPKLNLRVSVKEITADQTDFKGEFWDYFFADTNASKPEVCWSVLLASKKINGSPHTKDNYTYSDLEGRDDVEFTISKDDIFYLNVYDYDMLSFSDLVGSMRIDMNDMQPFSGSNFTSKFGKVLKMDFVVTIM